MSDQELRKWPIEQIVMINAGHNISVELIVEEAGRLLKYMRPPRDMMSLYDQIHGEAQ